MSRGGGGFISQGTSSTNVNTQAVILDKAKYP